jgi:hypothetical protein
VRSHSGDWSYEQRRPRSRRPLRNLLSIGQVLAVAAATFFILPLLVHAQPVDPIATDGDVLHCEFTGQVAYPGDTVYCRFRIGTNTHLDATFYTFTNEDTVTVLECLPADLPACPQEKLKQVPREDPRYTTFLNFWKFSALTRPVITRSLPEDHDVTYDPRDPAVICPPKLLFSYDAGPNYDVVDEDGNVVQPANSDTGKMCNLGVIRGIAGPRNFTDDAQPAYERQYLFAMTECDCGDQTEFAGWGLKFDLVIRAVIPVDPDPCPSSRVSGICTTPVYERA